MRLVGTAPLAGGIRVVIVVDPVQVAALGRVALAGRTTYRGAAADSRWIWKPPVLSPVMFHGVADSAAVPRDVAEVMRGPAATLDMRPFIGGIMLLLLAAAVVVLPTIAWGDPEGIAPVPRTPAPSTSVANLPSREPRSPDDTTLQTARRTALGR
jgi:hypothetical protein